MYKGHTKDVLKISASCGLFLTADIYLETYRALKEIQGLYVGDIEFLIDYRCRGLRLNLPKLLDILYRAGGSWILVVAYAFTIMSIAVFSCRYGETAG